MEKIQIQCKESDYKIYYDYCLSYYNLNDAIRKHSLHTYLDLFEKGIIPVGEHDINQARKFLSGKCDDLKKEQSSTNGVGETTKLLQMRICSDLLFLSDDLEKIYRLIQKQGIVPNYLMILGTFSRVIDENKNSQISGMYDLDRDVIESLALPIAETIQLRLGTDRLWRSVLHELTFIATRFNQKYPEPKFDLDIILLIAPAVVSHFQKDVASKEILSELPSYFEESELEEFEAFLNRTPDLLNNYQNAEINWDAIYEPLKVVASAVKAQRDQWSQGRSKISDHYSPGSLTGIQSTGNGIYPVDAASPLPASLALANRYKTFDIVVGQNSHFTGDSPINIYPRSDQVSVKSRMKPFIPVIIGILVIIIFILGTLIVSGHGNLTGVGNATNTTAVALKNVTSAKLIANPVAAIAKNVTTAKPVANQTAPVSQRAPISQSYSSTDIGNHLVEIAFGTDNSIIHKPTKNFIDVSFSGMYDDGDIALLNNFINQFNNYSSTTKISGNVNLNGQSEIWLDFLPGTSLDQIKIDEKTSVFKDVQTGTFYFIRTEEKTYVNSDLNGNERSRWILRALLNNLGFFGETTKYSDSLFYSGANNVSQMSNIDLKALQLMYGKKITNGMTKATVKLNI